jgi:hypothetical protein
MSMSPNHHVLATVRSVPEDNANSSSRQLNYTRRISRGVLLVCPIYQTGSRSVTVPSSFEAFLRTAEVSSLQLHVEQRRYPQASQF